MLFLALIWRIKLYFKIIFYKIIFGDKIFWSKNIRIRNNFNILIDGGIVRIGNGCFFNNNCSITAKEEINIGDNCIFGENVKIYDHNHKFSNNNLLIKEQGFNKKKIEIGKNCWIGSNVLILKGAEIGDNVVIAAGCIIKDKIPSNTLFNIKPFHKLENVKYKD